MTSYSSLVGGVVELDGRRHRITQVRRVGEQVIVRTRPLGRFGPAGYHVLEDVLDDLVADETIELDGASLASDEASA